jgi:hypothetical protein
MVNPKLEAGINTLTPSTNTPNLSAAKAESPAALAREIAIRASANITVAGRETERIVNRDGSISFRIPVTPQEASSSTFIRLGGESQFTNLSGLVRVEAGSGKYRIEKSTTGGQNSLLITLPKGQADLNIEIGGSKATLKSVTEALGIPNAGTDGASLGANPTVRNPAEILGLNNPITDLGLRLNADGSISATIRDASNDVSFKWLNNDGITQNRWSEKQLVYQTNGSNGLVTNSVQRIYSTDEQGREKYSIGVNRIAAGVYDLNIRVEPNATAIGLKTGGKEYLITRQTLEELRRLNEGTESSPSDRIQEEPPVEAPSTRGSSVAPEISQLESLQEQDDNLPPILGVVRRLSSAPASAALGIVDGASVGAIEPVLAREEPIANRTVESKPGTSPMTEPDSSAPKGQTTEKVGNQDRSIKTEPPASEQRLAQDAVETTPEKLARARALAETRFAQLAESYKAGQGKPGITPEHLDALRNRAETYGKVLGLTPDEIKQKLNPGDTGVANQATRSVNELIAREAVDAKPNSTEANRTEIKQRSPGTNFFEEFYERRNAPPEAPKILDRQMTTNTNSHPPTPEIKVQRPTGPRNYTLTGQPTESAQATTSADATSSEANRTQTPVERQTTSTNSAETSGAAEQTVIEQAKALERFKASIPGSEWARNNPFKAATAMVALTEAISGALKTDTDPNSKHSALPSLVQSLLPELSKKTSFTNAEIGDTAARLIDATRGASDATLVMGGFAGLDKGAQAFTPARFAAGFSKSLGAAGVVGVAYHGYSTFSHGQHAEQSDLQLLGSVLSPVANGAIVGGFTTLNPVGAAAGAVIGAGSIYAGLQQGNPHLAKMIESSWERREAIESLALADQGFLLPADAEVVRNREVPTKHQEVLDELAKMRTLNRVMSELNDQERRDLGFAQPANDADDKTKGEIYQRNLGRVNALLEGRSSWNPVRLVAGDYLEEVRAKNQPLADKFMDWHNESRRTFIQSYKRSPQVEFEIDQNKNKLTPRYELHSYIEGLAKSIPNEATDAAILDQLGKAFPEMDQILSIPTSKSLLINKLESGNPSLVNGGRLRKLLELEPAIE